MLPNGMRKNMIDIRNLSKIRAKLKMRQTSTLKIWKKPLQCKNNYYSSEDLKNAFEKAFGKIDNCKVAFPKTSKP